MLNVHHSKIVKIIPKFTWGLMLLCVFTLNGCVEPTSIIKEPKSAKPVLINKGENTNGAIYNAKTFRAMFADRRPQFVGDIVTIRIAENTSARKNESNTNNSSNSINTAISSLFGKNIPKATIGANGERSSDDSATSDMRNVFSGLITATVVEVLPNNFLLVKGEKQVGFDTGTEFVRISGVVNPDNILQGNVVPSTSIGDAKIEYRTNTKVDASEIVSKFARFFLSMGF